LHSGRCIDHQGQGPVEVVSLRPRRRSPVRSRNHQTPEARNGLAWTTKTSEQEVVVKCSAIITLHHQHYPKYAPGSVLIFLGFRLKRHRLIWPKSVIFSVLGISQSSLDCGCISPRL
jgi:hypothetical protein